jgi:hypothetical protein
VAVFGALLAHRATFIHGERLALFIAAAVVLVAAVASSSLERQHHRGLSLAWCASLPKPAPTGTAERPAM